MRTQSQTQPRTVGTLVALATVALAAASGPQAHAAKFANQFVEFELPPQWSCNLEGAEWVCQSADEGKKRDAIIVLAAKLKGDQDSLDQYESYLAAAKTYTSVQGKPVKSEPKYHKSVNINGQAWVDALHMESEIPGFYTRYLATVKQDIGVLVTYSVNKAKYQQYLEPFENMVKTLKVFRKPGAINTSAGPSGNLFSQTQIPTGAVSDTTVFPGGPIGGNDNAPKPAQDKSSGWLPILGIAGIVGFLIWRRRKSQQG